MMTTHENGWPATPDWHLQVVKHCGQILEGDDCPVCGEHFTGIAAAIQSLAEPTWTNHHALSSINAAINKRAD